MSYRYFSTLVAVFVIGGASASAQTAILQRDPSQTILKTALLTPLASSSFAVTSFGGTFNGSTVAIGLSWVSLSAPTGPVTVGMLGWKESGIVVSTPQGIANGNYSVALSIPWANAPATMLVFRNPGMTLVAQCAIQQQSSYAAGSPVQRCDSGPIAVSDGNLNLIFEIQRPATCDTSPQCISAQQLNVSQVTLNLWR